VWCSKHHENHINNFQSLDKLYLGWLWWYMWPHGAHNYLHYNKMHPFMPIDFNGFWVNSFVLMDSVKKHFENWEETTISGIYENMVQLWWLITKPIVIIYFYFFKENQFHIIFHNFMLHNILNHYNQFEIKCNMNVSIFYHSSWQIHIFQF